MAAQTYDILFNLIANVQGFRNAETRINRLNRALDRLNRRLVRTRANFALLGGASSLIGGGIAESRSFVGGIPGGGTFGANAGAAAFGAAVGSASISQKNRREFKSRTAGSYRRQFVREMPPDVRSAFAGTYPFRSAGYRMADMASAVVPPMRRFHRRASVDLARAEQYYPSRLGAAARGINQWGGTIGLIGGLGLGYAGYKGIQVQQQRQQEQLVAYTLASQKEREMLFPKGFDPADTNPIIAGLAQQYGIQQSGMYEGFKIGKTYGLPFDKFLGNADEFGKLMSGLSIFAESPDKIKRAFLHFGQVWQTDRVEMRDVRQGMEIGLPYQEELQNRLGLDLRDLLAKQDDMSSAQRLKLREFLISFMFEFLTGTKHKFQGGKMSPIIGERREKLYGTLAALEDTGTQLFKSFGEGLDAQGRFTALLNDMNTSLRDAIPSVKYFGNFLIRALNPQQAAGTGHQFDTGYPLLDAIIYPFAWAGAQAELLADPNFSGSIAGPRLNDAPGVDGYININVNAPAGSGVSVSKGGRGTSKFKVNN